MVVVVVVGGGELEGVIVVAVVGVVGSGMWSGVGSGPEMNLTKHHSIYLICSINRLNFSLPTPFLRNGLLLMMTRSALLIIQPSRFFLQTFVNSTGGSGAVEWEWLRW